MRYVVFGVFITVVSLTATFGHRYIWRRLVRDTELSGIPRRLATGLIVALGLLIPLAMSLGRRVSREGVEALYLSAYSWMGIFAYLVALLLITDAVTKGPSAWRRWRARVDRVASDDDEELPEESGASPRQDNGAPDPSRRLFMARATAGVATASAGGLFVIGSKNALGEVDVREFSVALPRLPSQLDGLKIVQLTDVHIGPLLDGRFLEAVVEKTNAQKPDVVVITGDLVDGPVSLIGNDVARLGKLQSRYGSYFCTGNHEYYSGAGEWLEFLESQRIRTLMNERVSIGDRGPGGASIDLAGIPDRQGRMFNDAHAQSFERTMAGRDPERELVLLSHRPNPIDGAAEHGVGLQLSGHTHGGQFFPVTAIGELIHPYNAGLHRHNDLTQIYVSRGTGFWGPPIRILAPAEITAITLTAS